MGKTKTIRIISMTLMCILIVGTCVYLNNHLFLCSVDFNNLDLVFKDTTNVFIEYNEFEKVFLMSGFGLLCLYYIYYRFQEKHSSIDRIYLAYFIMNFVLVIICGFPKGSPTSVDNGSFNLFILFINAITYFKLIPISIVLYIPLVYRFIKVTR